MTTLIDQVLAGNSEAVVKLYKLYAPKILTYLKTKLPEEDAKDVLSETFLEAIDGLPTLQKKENFSAWLYKIAHNKIVDFYRKQKIKSVLLSQMPFFDIMAQEINQPEFVYEKNKIRDTIETVLKKLSASQQTILRLHYERDIPVKRIAKILQLSFKATESLLFRARQSFKKTYERA